MHALVLKRALFVACLSLTASALSQAQIAEPHGRESAGNIDVRVNSQSALPKVTVRSAALLKKTSQARSEAAGKAIARLQSTLPGAEVSISPITGTAEVVRGSRGLTLAAPGKTGIEIVRGFLSDHADLYGLTAADVATLHFIGESVSPGSGLRMVRVEQMVNGRPVFQSESRFTLDRQGRIIRSVGQMAADATASAPPLGGLISAPEALVSAMATVGMAIDRAPLTLSNTAGDGMKTEIVAGQPGITRNVTSELVYFPAAPGSLIPAWSQVTFTSGEGDWYTLVDAWTGALLWRKNLRAHASTQDARFRVYVQADGKTPADSPAPLSPTTATVASPVQAAAIAPTIVSMAAAQDIGASPNGWISDGGTTTTGNNVDAYLDRIGTPDTEIDVPDAGTLDNNGRPIGNPDAASRNRDFLGTTPRDFQTNFLPPPQGGNPESGQTASGDASTATNSFRRGSVTHLFYLANWYHDQLYRLGFDEAAGNFQTTNFTGQGSGGDPVLAEAQDSSGTNNANFSTPPDGQSGRMQMYVFDGPTIDRDGSLDAEIVLHEMTHGLSNRLIGNGSGLSWSIGGGMGEGWSDFYALSLLNNTNADDPNGNYAMGGYATYKLSTTYTSNYLYGIRRFPYSTNNSVNPLTWADVDQTTNSMTGGIAVSPLNFNGNGALEVHNVGEVWALTLWEVRSRIIADPNVGNGDVPTGNHATLQLITDALKLTPINPSFISARDAILDADAADAGTNEASIWGGFADRGLGYGAYAPFAYEFGYTSGHTGIRESFSVPYLDVQSVSIDDSIGNNNGALDPNEPVKITVRLKNPWRSTSKNVASATATLTSSDVSVDGASSTYPAIPALGDAAGSAFLVRVPGNATAGKLLKFTITTNSSLGTHAVDFTLRVGTPGGTGAPVTYTRNIAGGLAIPDASPAGVIDSLNITDEFEIADLNFRIDSLTHTYVLDLTAMLRGPNGFGTDLIAATGQFEPGNTTNPGSGDNFINTVIDDQATADLNAATVAQAPYTGSWLPTFFSPSWDGAFFAGSTREPVAPLSRLNGTSTLGTWKLVVSDQFSGDTGTLNGWSLIITPRTYSVNPFVPTAAVAATQSVSGTFLPGNTITYTVVLTNTGNSAQGDNPGDEFTETLPSQLTLVSASATSGAALASAGTNGVTWNGSIPANGGQVTITITATLKSGTGTQTVSAQGTVNYDADQNATNESSASTDDPSTVASADATSFTVPSPSLSGTQTVAGIFATGGTVKYTILLTNGGTGPQPDNSGDEFTETLPVGLTLVSSSSSSGTTIATVASNQVTWNGSLAAGATVTITITATINPGTAGQTITSQGSLAFDPTLSGNNTSTAVTDDPNVAGAANPTSLTVGRFEDVALVATKHGIDIAVLSNDIALGNNLRIIATTNGQYGTVFVNPNGTIHYTATDKMPPGGDSFTYTATDGNGGTYTVKVDVHNYADAAATFTGLVLPPAAVNATFANTGTIQLKVSKTGSFSAALLLGGKKFSLRGTIDSTGSATFGKDDASAFILERKGLSPLLVSLNLPLGGDLDTIEGTIFDNLDPFGAFTADRAFYTSKKNPVAPLLNVPADLLGKYTAIFVPHPAPNQGVPADHYPQGYGFGSITVSSKGVAKLTGKLADGSTISSASPLSRANQWPFYAVLARGLGSIGGPATFEDNVNTDSDLDGLNLNWFLQANSKAKIYPDGWPDGILTDLLGSKFVKPDQGNLLGTLPTSPTGNVSFTLADGGLPPPGNIVLDANLTEKNKVEFLAAPTDLKLKLTLAPTGLIKGGFVHPEGKKSSLQGVIFQRQDRGFGYFLGPDESGSLELDVK